MNKLTFIEELIPDTPCKLLYFEKIKLFNLMKEKTVLDLGCGTGYFTFLISKFAKKVYALDIAKENIEYCKKMDINADFIVGDALKIPLKKNCVDFIFCSEVLEHLGDYKKGLSEIDRILKNGGFVLLTFPIQPFLPTTRFLYNFVDKFNELFYGKNHPQVHKEKLSLVEVEKELHKKGCITINIGKTRNTLATLICESIIFFEKLVRIIRFGKRARKFQLGTQAHNTNLIVVKIWKVCIMPFIKVLMKIDSYFDGFDSTCGVILAKKDIC